jgi:hypothetical protein
LNHPNQYVVGLALCALANISSPEIARDVASEVQKLLSSSNPFIRKKVSKFFLFPSSIPSSYLASLTYVCNIRASIILLVHPTGS